MVWRRAGQSNAGVGLANERTTDASQVPGVLMLGLAGAHPPAPGFQSWSSVPGSTLRQQRLSFRYTAQDGFKIDTNQTIQAI